MNHQQAAGAMATLRAAFGKEVDDRMMEVWYGSALERCDVEIARETIAVIVRDDQFFPTPARFNEVRRAVERAHAPSVAALPPAPQSPAQVDRVRQIIDKTRAKLQGKSA